ncbi:hypothetical protein [Microbacterium sp. PA5]|uniref:hypothetical protein n=1 Tax=Microbacterium sp. PA5 TaxID=3416654 RepID=UPI003CE9B168
MSEYAWKLSQVPVIIAHLRDSMIPLAATDYDRTRVDGTRDPALPLRIEPMQDADDLWAALTAYGAVIGWHITPAPHALTTRLTASVQWHEAGDAAHTITAWLIHHEDRIAQLDLTVIDDHGLDVTLFTLIGRLLAKYRITPARLRTSPTRCRVCGEHAVRAEWAPDRTGTIHRTVQCTVCLTRYDPTEEVTHEPAVDVPAGSETSPPFRPHHQTVAAGRDADAVA